MSRITELKKEILAQELLIRETKEDLQKNICELSELQKVKPDLSTQKFWQNLQNQYHPKHAK